MLYWIGLGEAVSEAVGVVYTEIVCHAPQLLPVLDSLMTGDPLMSRLAQARML